MSGFNFEALTGSLGMETDGWDRGFSRAYGTLGKFSNDVASKMAEIASTTNTSLDEVVATSEKLADVLGSDLKSAATLLADAMKDPVNGITALTEAGLKFSASQQEEVASLMRSGLAFDAYDAILNRVADSHKKLTEATSLVGVNFDTIVNEKLTDELNEQLRIKNDMAEIDRQIAGNYEYEAKLLDDLLHKWEVEAQLKERAEAYRNIPAGDYSSSASRTASEDEAMQSGGGFGFGSLAPALSRVPGAALVAGGGVAAGAAVVAAAAKEYAEAEEAAMRLNAVLEATGHASGFTSERLAEMSEALQAETQFTGTAITEAQAFIASLKEIKGDNFRATLDASADLATFMKTDLTSAAKILGRALVDPEEGMQALRRANIFLTDEQEASIKSFMKVNDVAAAQRVMLDALNGSIGTLAEESAETLIGKWNILKRELGDAAEAIGEKLEVPLSFMLDFGNVVVKVVQAIISPIDTLNSIIARLGETLLQVRIAWNDFWGDVSESDRLKVQLEELKAEREKTENPPAEKVWKDPVQRMAAERAAQRGGGGGGNSGGSRGSSGGSAMSSSGGVALHSGRSSDRYAFEGVDERFDSRQRDAAFNSSFLKDLKPEQSGRFVAGMRDEITHAVAGNGLRVDTTGNADTNGFEKIMAIYRASAEKMQGFDAQQWDAMQQRAITALRMATVTSGQMRELHLRNLSDALGAGEKMFDDYGKKLEEAKELAAKKEAEAAAKVKEQAEQQKKRDAAMHPGGIGPAGPGDYYGDLQNASSNQIQGRLSEMRGGLNNSVNAMQVAGIGTAEQRRGIVELGRQMQDMLKQVGNSSGDARAKNIEELKKMEDSFAKAFEAIRNGSKETADKLIEDAKRQGEAVLEANKKAKAQASDPIGDVFDMSRQLGGAMSGAFGGRNLGVGMAGFNEIAAGANSPLERLDLAIKSKSAEVGMAGINNFGGRAAGLEALNNLQRELAGLQKRRQEILQQQNEERLQAEKQQQEGYQRRQVQKSEDERQRAREAGMDVAALVGDKAGGITINFHGVTDTKDFVDKLDKELQYRGIDLSGKGRLGRNGYGG